MRIEGGHLESPLQVSIRQALNEGQFLVVSRAEDLDQLIEGRLELKGAGDR